MARAAFLRGMGAVYGFAFLSLARQSPGLFGEHGLLPAATFLSTERAASAAFVWLRVPSVFWVDASDAALFAVACVGLLLSLAVMAGSASSVVLGALWVIYLSFVSVGQVFTVYRGDLLLLEAGFLAIFVSPSVGWRPAFAPPRLFVLLLRWLAFRVLFGAGIAKLRSDPCWASLTCLPDALETQATPTVFAFYEHALPLPFHRAATAVVLVAELVVPFGFFAPRRVRHTAALITVLVSALTLLVANGDFGGFIVIVLMCACVDDRAFSRLPFVRACEDGSELGRKRKIGVAALAAVLATLSVVELPALFFRTPGIEASLEPFHLVNTYGVLEPVERQRSEVVFEGTWGDVAAGPVHWFEYELPCKPGEPTRRPCLPSPYTHRLDARLHEASLGDFRREAWVIRLVDGLLRGTPEVTSLFSRNPFAAKPPRFVRAERYHYRFSRSGEPRYWQRELVEDFIRPFSLEDPALFEYLFRKGWLPDY